MKRALLRLDQKLIRRVEGHRSHSLDTLFIGASRAANRSAIWLAVSGLLVAVGGPRGKRAAGQGLAAIAATSAIVNGPLKLVFDRARPSSRPPLIRRPRTTSFPSGHAASAFAFATAVSQEVPVAGLLLLPLALTVSYSRVYVGVHYPSDVVLGAAVGAGTGVLVASSRESSGDAAEPS